MHSFIARANLRVRRRREECRAQCQTTQRRLQPHRHRRLGPRRRQSSPRLAPALDQHQCRCVLRATFCSASKLGHSNRTVVDGGNLATTVQTVHYSREQWRRREEGVLVLTCAFRAQLPERTTPRSSQRATSCLQLQGARRRQYAVAAHTRPNAVLYSREE